MSKLYTNFDSAQITEIDDFDASLAFMRLNSSMYRQYNRSTVAKTSLCCGLLGSYKQQVSKLLIPSEGMHVARHLASFTQIRQWFIVTLRKRR